MLIKAISATAVALTIAISAPKLLELYHQSNLKLSYISIIKHANQSYSFRKEFINSSSHIDATILKRESAVSFRLKIKDFTNDDFFDKDYILVKNFYDFGYISNRSCAIHDKYPYIEKTFFEDLECDLVKE